MHLKVKNLALAYEFYPKLGFRGHVVFPEMGFGDLGAGGRFKHRIGLNTWQGLEAPQAPLGTARMRYFVVRFTSINRLDATLNELPETEKHGDGFAACDPAAPAAERAGTIREKAEREMLQ
jgi:catechol 2,3-dioxygenase